MILRGGTTNTMALAVPCRPRVPSRLNCCSSNIDTEQLRSQLDQLHAEAESTRAKANSARLRLLRLSEAAEKLKRQAAMNVRTGNENDAMDLLFQKKKVMKAMEKSKSRIELLDELFTKLNEAISIKESQLIGNVALDLPLDKENTYRLVRIVSPKHKLEEEVEDRDIDPNTQNHGSADDQVLQNPEDRQASLFVDKETEDCEGSTFLGYDREDNIISSLREISSYQAFLENIDLQLTSIEEELVTVLNISTLIIDNKEKQRNIKVQQAVELLDRVHDIRERIASFKDSMGETS